VDASDFGRYLIQQREFRGLSREEVSSATKIPLTLVGALEEGHLERLPSRVFVVNFIRSYAQVIGLEPDDAVLRFQEMAGGVPEGAPPEPVTAVKKPRSLKALGWALGLLLLGSLGLLARVVVSRGR
jgi:cytoskeletal protein RodZ